MRNRFFRRYLRQLGVTLGGSGVMKKFRLKENVYKISVKDCILIKFI